MQMLTAIFHDKQIFHKSGTLNSVFQAGVTIGTQTCLNMSTTVSVIIIRKAYLTIIRKAYLTILSLQEAETSVVQKGIRNRKDNEDTSF